MKILKDQTWWLRVFFFVFGLMLFAFGIALTIRSDLGVSAWDAVSVGLYDMFSLSVGTWMNATSILLILLGARIKKERPKIECMITSIVMSAFVDLFLLLLEPVAIQTMWMQLLVYTIGVLVVACGCGTYLHAQFPPCPIDYFMMAMKVSYRISIQKAMTICEASGFTLALLVQGPIGVGTFLSVVVYGPLIQFFHQLSHRTYLSIEAHLPQVVHNAVDI